MTGYQFDEENHVHTYNGIPLHGVSTVLSCWIGQKKVYTNPVTNKKYQDYPLVNSAVKKAVAASFKKNATKEVALMAHITHRDAAASKGNDAHGLLETAMKTWIKTETLPTIPENETLNNVLTWLQEHNYKPIRSEYSVYDLHYKYAGILDGIVERDGKYYLLDFKTGKTINTKHWYQCGAYSYGYKKLHPEITISGAMIMHIPRGSSFNPSYCIYQHHGIEKLEQAWLNILHLYLLDKELYEFHKKY